MAQPSQANGESAANLTRALNVNESTGKHVDNVNLAIENLSLLYDLMTKDQKGKR